ncbi:uncharacterized protein LOC144920377 isoform X2 [Branchiostoma floridae x Branchiostoma belcheri]
MPRRRKVPKTKRLSAWKAKQEVERLADEQEAEITDQEPAVEQEVELREEEPSDEQEVEVTGQGPAVEQEVEVTGAWEGQDGQFMFNPLTADDQMYLAGQLNLPVAKPHNMKQRNVPLEPPRSSDLVRIEKDGNCFYRAISHHICGTQMYHHVVRQHLIHFMSTLSEDVYRSWFDGGLTMDQYLARADWAHNGKRPGDFGAWATEVEMDAMALFLGIRIFLYTKYGNKWTWCKYPSNENIYDKTMSETSNAVYLQHENEDHFNVVTTVLSRRQTRSMSRCCRQEGTEASEAASSKRKITLNDNNDDDRKKAKRERERKRYQEDETYAQAQRDRKKTRYHTDEDHAQAERDRKKERYHADEDHAQEKRDKTNERYHTDEDHAQAERDRKKERYHTDEDHAQAERDRKKERYHTDEDHAQAERDRKKERYHADEEHAQEKRDKTNERYHTDEDHAQAERDRKKERYHADQEHAQDKRDREKDRYHTDPEQRDLKKRNVQINRERNQNLPDVNKAIEKFQVECKKGPEYVCTVCHRLLFRNQVVICHKEKYVQDVHFCLTGKYVHECNENCSPNACSIVNTSKGKEWVCHCCHEHLRKKKTIPFEAQSNRMKLPEIPPELNSLNTLESQLIAKRIPFMKVAALPKGGQKGVIGPVVCVPADVSETHAVLPRMPTEALLIKVKLKRKLQYSGHYMYRQISPMKVDAALKYLVENNEHYRGTSIDADWALSWNEEEGLVEPSVAEPRVEDNSEARTIPEHGESVSQDGNGMVGTTEDGMEDDEMDNILQQVNVEEAVEEAALTEEEVLDNNLRGLPHDTCLQPIDIGQEFLDHHDEHILCVAPGEGKEPVSVFQEVGGEAMSFPVQFPTGKFSFNDERDVRITPSKYFKARLMGADTRFARDTSYIFFAQYVTELRFIQSNISISMRKGSPTTSDGRRISAGMLSNREDLQAILKSDQGYRFLQPVRGTPQFWDRALNELYAMIRQLGIPTWFATFSAADLRWPEVLEAIRQDDSTVPVSDLSWEERCDILKSNPVTAARMFDHRVKQFFKHVIKSPSQPIGEVVDTFTRTEFQQRGSPHIHCLFWVKDAPKLNVNSEEEICAFVDKYVSSQLPNPETDRELFDIVSQVQMHRKGHTTSCKKGGKVCRFGFPKPPVKQTFLCSPVALQDLTDEELASISEKKKQAEAVLKHFWDVLDKKNEPENCSTEDLLKEAKITSAQLCEALNLMATRKQVMLRREPKDMWVNNYNPHLLRAWNANIDIQYVLDAYSCVRYIVSYISKAEREMGKLLKQAQKEAREGNEDVVTEMKKVGTKYLHHREVSAQEAVYRVCSLKLKDCSRDVIFIPTDEHANRLSKPLAAIQQMASEGNSEDESIWMPSIMDRYKARPREEPFCSMCAAEFVSEYRVVSRSGTQDNGEQSSRGEVKHVLRDNLGAVQKRTRSKPAVIRFAKFNKAKEPERYYLTLLKLYLPHYNDAQLKPPQYEKYEEFYSDGFAPLPNTNNKVDAIVHANRRKFEQNVDEIEQARKDVEDGSFVEDVWAQIFPELEQERLECQNNAGNQVNEDEDTQDDIPDLAPTDRPKEKSFTLEACQTKVPSNVAIPMMQSLNPKQQEVFYFVRKWCMETAQGKRPDPFHIFLTGGAGTGKSHLIKCICYEATRLLQQTQENPDSVSVLLAAPTGTAAFNIGGSTIHHAFHLMCKSNSKDFQDLSESTVNAMRAQYESLKIVIVDEVSMVDKPLMKFIHLRLRQLRQRPNALFGNVSILAVGDMYQVPPVKGISLYKERDRDISDLWNPNFEVVELEEIMRQKDDAAFAKLLNRMRVKRKKDKLSDEDDEVLSSRVLSVDFEADDYPKDALHIFSTNIAVAEHNDKMLRLRCPDVRCFEASDFVKDPTTGSMKRRDLARGGKNDLPDVVKVGVGARVMLSRNVNVADGLVNGAFGTVSGVAGGQDDAREVATVFVQFDNPKAGALERQKSAVPSSLPVNSVPVRQIEDNLNNKSKVKRNQIPLKLAWGCTVHKVQGMTTDEVVVSMKKVFVSGMAYVALSRVRSIAGLHITDYKQGSIYCDEEVQGAISDMKHFKFVSNPFTNVGDRSENEVSKLNIVHHNTEGLVAHFKSLKSTCLVKADIICLTETWLSENVPSSQVQLESFNMFRKDRSGRRVCEDGSSATSNAPHGGVAVYVRDVYRCSEIPIPDDIGLECVVMQVSAEGMDHLIVAIYRAPNVHKDLFISSLEKLLQHLTAVERNNTVIVGDFNENLLSSEDNKKIQSFLMRNGYEQLIEAPTTMKGTLIDHVYMSALSDVVNHGVIQTFYSYHDAVYCVLCCAQVPEQSEDEGST